MAITEIGDEPAQSSSATSIAPSEPVGAAAGDFAIFGGHINSNTNDGDWTKPADFNWLTTKDETGGTPDNQIAIAWKIRGADAGDGYSFGYSGAAKPMAGALLLFRGVDPVTPFDVPYVEASHYAFYANDSLSAAKPINIVTGGAAVLLFQFLTQSIGTGPPGMPTGYTESESIQMTASGRAMTSCYKIVGAPGTETPGVWLHTDSNGTSDTSNFTLALRPFIPAAAGVRLIGSKLLASNLFGRVIQ